MTLRDRLRKKRLEKNGGSKDDKPGLPSTSPLREPRAGTPPPPQPRPRRRDPTLETDTGQRSTTPGKVTARNTGVYDDTQYAGEPGDTADQRPMRPDISPIARFTRQIEADDLPTEMKIAKVKEVIKHEWSALVSRFGNEKKLLDFIGQASAKPENTRTKDEKMVLRVVEDLKPLKELRERFEIRWRKEKIRQQGSGPVPAQQPPAPKADLEETQDLEPLESEEPSAPPEPVTEDSVEVTSVLQPVPNKPPGRFKEFVTDPWPWTILAVAGYAVAMNVTDSFNDLTQGIKNAIDSLFNIKIDLSWHDVERVGAAVIATIAGLELIRRIRSRRKARQEQSVAQKELLTEEQRHYLMRILDSILEEHKDGASQTEALKDAMLENEELFDYLDKLFINDVDDLATMFEDAGFDADVLVRFELVHQIAETAIVKNKLELLYKHGPEEDFFPGYVQMLDERDPLLKRKLDEIFAQTEDGSYKNKNLRMRLRSSKMEEESQPERIAALLDKLEETWIYA